jgi:hypothetical protein
MRSAWLCTGNPGQRVDRLQWIVQQLPRTIWYYIILGTNSFIERDNNYIVGIIWEMEKINCT